MRRSYLYGFRARVRDSSLKTPGGHSEVHLSHAVTQRAPHGVGSRGFPLRAQPAATSAFPPILYTANGPLLASMGHGHPHGSGATDGGQGHRASAESDGGRRRPAACAVHGRGTASSLRGACPVAAADPWLRVGAAAAAALRAAAQPPRPRRARSGRGQRLAGREPQLQYGRRNVPRRWRAAVARPVLWGRRQAAAGGAAGDHAAPRRAPPSTRRDRARRRPPPPDRAPRRRVQRAAFRRVACGRAAAQSKRLPS
eukprot:scaffold106458_cov48-Phaeocystis_antarctica.AAC.1